MVKKTEAMLDVIAHVSWETQNIEPQRYRKDLQIACAACIPTIGIIGFTVEILDVNLEPVALLTTLANHVVQVW